MNPLTPVVNLVSQKLPGVDLDTFSEQQVMRMREMTGPDIKIDKSAKFGENPAHRAISSLQIPGTDMVMRFFSLWSIVNGYGYSFFFHCPADKYQSFGSILTYMTKSFQTIKVIQTSYPLETFHDNGIIFRYPSSWKAVKRTGTTPF